MLRNKLHIIFLVILFIGISAPSTFAQKNIMKANMYYNSQLYSQAIDYFVKELELKNKATQKEAMIKLANCYKQTGAFIEAEKIYKLLMVTYGKREPEFIYEYANALRSSSKYAEAIEFFEKYKKERPKDPMTDQCIESCIQAEIWLVEPGNYFVRNMKEFNSTTSDASPIIYGDTIFFVSSRQGSVKKVIDLKEGGKSTMLDLYYVDLDDTTYHVENKGYLKGLNTYLHEGPATFTPDQRQVYFTRTVRGRKNKKKEMPVSLQIYVSQKTASGDWGIARSAVSFNNLAYSVAHPSISPDGKKMIFASDMKGGFGATDLYISELTSGGQWGKPINLGEIVNTFGNELTPFFYNDSTIYFSSDAHPGMGKKDIFMASYVNGVWQDVVNLKPPINSLANDFGFVKYSNQGIGFFTSDRFNGMGSEDIYSFIELDPIELVFDTNSFKIQDQSFFNEASYQLADDNSNVKIDVPTDTKNFYFSITDTVKYTIYERREGLGYNKISVELQTNLPDAIYKLNVRPAQLPIKFKGVAYNSEITEVSSLDTSFSATTKSTTTYSVIPFASITITCKGDVVYEDAADSLGQYSFDFKPRKKYEIKVQKSSTDLFNFKGIVVNDKNEKLQATIALSDKSGSEVSSVIANENGEFSVKSSKDEDYIVTVSCDGYQQRRFKLDITKLSSIAEKNVFVLKSIPVKPVTPKQELAENNPKPTATAKPVVPKLDDSFYSIQVLATIQNRESVKVQNELTLSDSVMKYESQGVYRYLVLKFDDVEDAKNSRDLNYKKYGASVVRVVNGKVYSINPNPGKTIVEGKIVDEEEKPVKADIEFNDTETNRTVVKTESSESTGKYQATLDDGKRYGMVVTKDDYVFHSENINLTDSKSQAESEGQVRKNIQLQKPVPGTSIILNNVFFDYGKAEIKSQSIPELERVVKLMKENPNIRLEISGHTCNLSSWAFNKKLSQYRAYAVRDYLIARGISSGRLVAIGCSYDKPVADNSTEAGRVINRRTEFRIIR